MPEAPWDLAVEVLAIKRAVQRSHKRPLTQSDSFNHKHDDAVTYCNITLDLFVIRIHLSSWILLDSLPAAHN